MAQLISILFLNPVVFFLLIFSLIYSVIMHEIAHGWVAFVFGDITAKYYGRLSLNPMRHVDFLGLVMLLVFGFGWAKPVPINYENFKNKRLGIFSVAIAGCLVNFIIAVISIFFLQFKTVVNNDLLAMAFSILAKINITLAAFNLIPIPPLDGSKVLFSLLPEKIQYNFAKFEIFGIIILIILLATNILDPIIDIFNDGLVYLIRLIFSF